MSAGRHEAVLLPAVVPPWAAYVLVREYGGVLEDVEARAEVLLRAEQTAPIGRQLLQMVASVEESARRLVAAQRTRHGSGSGTSEGSVSGVAGSEVGTSAGASVPGGGGSSRPPGSWSTTREVATQLRVGVRRVTTLIADEELVATLVGGRWFIDPLSVAAYEQRRGRRRR